MQYTIPCKYVGKGLFVSPWRVFRDAQIIAQEKFRAGWTVSWTAGAVVEGSPIVIQTPDPLSVGNYKVKLQIPVWWGLNWVVEEWVAEFSVGES